MSTSGGEVTLPTINPMPPLLAAVREALTESIRQHGVICPVIKDQTGFVLDGHNRLDIAARLGVPCPEVIHECGPAQREILRIELNGARRQITADEWRPLVDHLRAQVTASGARRFSDRVVAQAVGIDRNLVTRYKSPVSAGGSLEPPAHSTVGEDGKVYRRDGQWTARSRTLHLIEQASNGITAADLLRDPVLCEFGEGTIRRLPGQLRDDGLVEACGKRNGSTLWRVRSVPAPRDGAPTVTRKAAKIMNDLADAALLAEVHNQMADTKMSREAKRTLRAAEKELEAARLDQEKREAEDERERLRLIEIARGQLDKSVKTWDKLIAEVRAAWTIIAAYSNDLGDLPALHPSFERMLDRELDELRRQLDWIDKRLHPGGGRGPLRRGSFIDVD